VGVTTYDCVAPPDKNTTGAFFYFFSSSGAKDVFNNESVKAEANMPDLSNLSIPPDPTSYVAGTGNWAVWGDVQSVTVKAVDLGGKQLF
jgi:hypothetical protein